MNANRALGTMLVLALCVVDVAAVALAVGVMRGDPATIWAALSAICGAVMVVGAAVVVTDPRK